MSSRLYDIMKIYIEILDAGKEHCESDREKFPQVDFDMISDAVAEYMKRNNIPYTLYTFNQILGGVRSQFKMYV